MTPLWTTGLSLVRQSLTQPRAAAARIIAMGRGFEPAELWLALVLLCVLSAGLTHLGLMLLPPSRTGEGESIGTGPLATAGLQIAIMTVLAALILLVGRRFGGRGDVTGSLSITLWLEGLGLALQVLQLAVLPLGADAADLIGLCGILVFWTLLAFFVAELHGFASVGKVFLGMLATLFAVAFVLALILTMMGVQIDV